MRLKSGIDGVFNAITAFLMLSMVVLMLLQVVSRYALDAPFSWTEELGLIDLVYLTFLGSVVAFHRRDHLRVELVVHALPPIARRWLRILVDVASMLVLGVVVWQGVPLLPQFWSELSPALQWPNTVFYVPIVLGCFVMMLYAAFDVVVALRNSAVGREGADANREVTP